MAHELDHQRGTAAFVSLQKSAWHGLGVIVEQEMSVVEALALGNLDFRVEKLPNWHKMPQLENPQLKISHVSNTSFFTYRTDTNFVLGDRLGKTYEVIQNAEALGVVDALVKEGGLIVETAGSLFDGRQVFMCCRLPQDLLIGGTDRVKQYLIIRTGHDGCTSIEAYFTNVRVVCHNTLQMSLSGATQKHSIRHTKNAIDKLQEAMKLMGLAAKNQAVSAATFDRMAQTQMKQGEFWNFVGNVFFSLQEIKALQAGDDQDKVISTRKKNVINDVIAFSMHGVGQQEANPGSQWWAYNAVTGYFSNLAKHKDAEHRMDSLLFGTEAQKMERALVLASQPEKIQLLRQQVAHAFNLN